MALHQPYISTYGVDELKQQDIQLAVHYGLGSLTAIKLLAIDLWRIASLQLKIL